jgi:transcriptional regulator with XRE-family HTH domain
MDQAITDKDIKKLLSKKLEQLRKKTGKTIEDTAMDLSLDYSLYFHLLRGKRLPRLTTLLNINACYGLTLDWWFKELVKPAPSSKVQLDKKIAEFQLLNSFNKLDHKCQRLILKMFGNLSK